MTGFFKDGLFIEDAVLPVQTDINQLADSMFTATYQHFAEFQKTQPCGVVWRESNTGFMVVATIDPKYAAALKAFIGGL